MSAPAVQRLVTPTGVLVTDAAPESEEWFAARRGGITGTDLPKILGDSQYGNALSVWAAKRGQMPDTAGEAARWGQLLEDVVASEWARREGARVAPVGVLEHAEHPWMRASLDRLVLGTDEGLEVKTRSAFKSGVYREDLPDDVLAQVLWGLAVTGLERMHVAVLLGGQELRSFTVERDEQVEGYLVEKAREVWEHVLAGRPPVVAPDEHGVLLQVLNALHPERAGAVQLPPEQALQWRDHYREAAAAARRAEQAKTEAKTALVALLGGADTGLLGEDALFTYRAPAASTSVPAKQLARLGAADPAARAALADGGYAVTTTPAPRLVLAKETR